MCNNNLTFVFSVRACLRGSTHSKSDTKADQWVIVFASCSGIQKDRLFLSTLYTQGATHLNQPRDSKISPWLQHQVPRVPSLEHVLGPSFLPMYVCSIQIPQLHSQTIVVFHLTSIHLHPLPSNRFLALHAHFLDPNTTLSKPWLVFSIKRKPYLDLRCILI